MGGKGSGRTSKTAQMMQQELMQNNPEIEYLSGYSNYSTKALFRCKVCGHEWHTLPKLVCGGHGCPECVRKRRHDDAAFTEQDFQKRLAEVLPGYELTSPYRGMSECVTVRCPQGHERTLRAATFLKRPDVGCCPECNPTGTPEDIDEATLRREYLDEGLGLTEIGKRHHRSYTFIKRRMQQYGIETRPRATAHDISYETLDELYVQQALPVETIASRLGCSVPCLYRHLRKHGLPKRNRGYKE